MPRAGLITVAAFGGLLLAALLWAVLAPPPEGTRPERGPTISLAQTFLTRYDDQGRPLWELQVDSLRLSREGITEGEGVTLRLFAPEARTEPILLVKAGAVELEDRTGNLVLSGGMEARAAELEFTTEEARWDAEKQVLYSDGPITARSPQGRLSGRGFRYSLKTGRLTIEHQARLILNPTTGRGEGERGRRE